MSTSPGSGVEESESIYRPPDGATSGFDYSFQVVTKSIESLLTEQTPEAMFQAQNGSANDSFTDGTKAAVKGCHETPALKARRGSDQPPGAISRRSLTTTGTSCVAIVNSCEGSIRW